MKRVLESLAVAGISACFASAACAADLPLYAKAPPTAAPGWTGFYVGVDVGYGWQDPTLVPNDFNSSLLLNGGFVGGSPIPNPTWENKGIFGGVTAGYNWQISRSWLVGVETDFNDTNINGQGNTAAIIQQGAGVQTVSATTLTSQSIQWFGTVRPRVGWLATDALLLYGTGGFAYGQVSDSVDLAFSLANANTSNGGFGFQCGAAGTPCFAGSASRAVTGWTAGGGAEYRVPGTNASFKLEYLYVDLGTGNAVTAISQPTPGNQASTFNAVFSRTAFETLKLGLNWHF
jgi:outer membrane immunogenic protein